jgi:hypothetical protein
VGVVEPPKYAPLVTPVGRKRYFAKAEERVEAPIRGACLVTGPQVWQRGILSGGLFSLLVLTADDLRVFSLRPAGWRHPNTDFLDTELMHEPLSAIDRLDRRPSIDPFVKEFRLTLTDGKQVTLRAARGGNHGADVIERLTDLIAGAWASPK